MNPERVHDLLERTAILARAEERRLAGEFGLQPVHLHALRYLARCNRYSDNPLAVAEYLGVTKGTASQTLWILKQQNFIESRPDANDARKQHLRLTLSGKRIVRRASPQQQFREALHQACGKGEELAEALEGFLRTMQRSNGFRPFGLCRSCRHFQHAAQRPQFRCGLTSETLSEDDSQRICREFQEGG